MSHSSSFTACQRWLWTAGFLGWMFIRPLQGGEWNKVRVPTPEISQESPIHAPPSRAVWYRCWVKVSDSFFTPHDRNLYEESAGLYITDLAGAHEAWVNGMPIGKGGNFPPDYRDGKASFHRHKIPVGTLQKGAWNEVAIRSYTAAGERSGFLGEAPFIMDYFMECVLKGTWEQFHGASYQPGTARLQRPGRARFDAFHESHRVLGRSRQVHGDRLLPEESARRMQSDTRLQTELVLHEPIVTQPFYFSFDARGRLWVTQSRQYPYPAGISMLSRDKYYRAHYDRIPPPPPHHTPGADKVTIHEDGDGDGHYETHTTFLEGLNMANAALKGRGGVWVMHTPYLLFYPDADEDDRPDGPPVVHLAGFGFEDSHSIANGLVWGPDGWLYGGQGSTCSCRVTRPGMDAEDASGVYFEGCMVWRYHPDSRAFEIFAEGGGNTYGLEFDGLGRLYSGHNGGQTRGWHFVQGGFYQMQGVNPGKFGPPRNPYAFGDLPMMSTSDPVVRFSHFGAFVEGSAMPSAFRGQLFVMDPLHHELIATQREQRGASFTTRDQGVVVRSSDPAFRPVYISNAPDGSLFVADMSEYYIAHGQHYQNQIDTTTGRIYRISGRGMPREPFVQLEHLKEEDWVALLSHPNKWHRQTAVRLLGTRGTERIHEPLREQLRQDEGHNALNALWALYQCGGLDAHGLAIALQHPQAAVRLWGVRLLGDGYGVHRNLGLSASQYPPALPKTLLGTLLRQSQIEPNAEVRAQMASTARRLEFDEGLELVTQLMRHAEDVDDVYIPLLCWWFFEAHLPARVQAVVTFLEAQALWREPVASRHLLPRIGRRLAVEGKRQDLLLLAQLIQAAPSSEDAAPLIRGCEEAFRGRSMAHLPEELLSVLSRSTGASVVVGIRRGQEDAEKRGIQAMLDATTPMKERLLYIRAFGETGCEAALEPLLELTFNQVDETLRKACYVALHGYDHPSIAEHTLRSLPKTKTSRASLLLLASRLEWTHRLLDAVETGLLKSELIPQDIKDYLTDHHDAVLRERALKILSETARLESKPLMQQMDALRHILGNGQGNPYAGEAIFAARCAGCHRLFFKGGAIGPDLTHYQRSDLSTLLPSILSPSAEIREGFQFIEITCRDGRRLGGFEVDRDLQVMMLRGLDGLDHTLPVDQIEQVQPMGRSLMPEGLLDGLNDQEMRDFFAYLRISQPILH